MPGYIRFIQAMANSLHTALVDMLKIMPHEESPLVVQFRDDMSILARLTSPEMSLESGTYYAEVVGSNQNFCSTILLAAQSVGKGRFKEQVESSLAAYYFSEVALKSRYGFSLPLGELCWTSDKTTDEVSISCIRSLWKRSLRTEDLESVCAAVGCTNLAPKKTCVRCKMAMYCDATCREAHWSLGELGTGVQMTPAGK
ncbi:hypothetical protein M427DRAFT_69071 [Gonapodya prolifera JEL478]|uniref:MYND-type domain-containing protein n=1 Tax=Gonapodya prolifera (strain JEL478) TaxID=1344416 RepID=A0A139AI86_GONPJ|nr:hypothetical protein M427DRAFT_69071 [Gonapodya prolifera JEL478]|eukprot:KXS16497.1 hypothetical protein M427DRAFT_69071 [Gonapodya prolifera JEL478]